MTIEIRIRENGSDIIVEYNDSEETHFLCKKSNTYQNYIRLIKYANGLKRTWERIKKEFVTISDEVKI